MKIKKTVSEKVISANCANAQKSPGPGDCTNVKNNAIKHDLRAKHLFFQNEDEENEYIVLLEQFEEYEEPDGPTECMLVEEIATCRWMLQGLNFWKGEEITNRRKACEGHSAGRGRELRRRATPLVYNGRWFRFCRSARMGLP